MKSKRFRIATSKIQFALPMIFIFIIGSITAADLFYWEKSYASMRLWQILSMFGAMILMMLLDMVDMIVFPRRMPYAIKVLLFFLRVALIAFIQMLDNTGSALSLVGLIPYYTFFALGGVVSVIFTLLLLGFFYTRIGQYGSDITLAVANLLFMQILSFITYHAHQVTLQNRALLEELHQANVELQLIADDVAELSAVEERMRLSRDLHDSVGHHLTAISIQLEKAVAYQDISGSDSMESVRNARTSAAEALKEVRQFISALKDNPDTFSFSDKVENLFKNLDQTGITYEWSITGDEKLYPLRVRRNLYHSLQELLTNVQKHATASEVKVTTKFGRRMAVLQVEDNGVGFDIRKLPSKDGHFGLKHLQERAALLDGSVEINSQKQQGTTVEIHIPRER